MCDNPLSWGEETVPQTQKKASNWQWPTADGSLKHDVLIMLPQHCQQVAAPQLVADKGDAGGLGTLGQSIWKAAKDCGGMAEWAVNHGPTAVRCNNGHFRKSALWSSTNLPLKDSFHTSKLQYHHRQVMSWLHVTWKGSSLLQTVPKHVS